MKTDNQKIKHLLGIENLKLEDFVLLLENAQNLVDLSEREIKKAPALRGKTIINYFAENSTRTRTSFEIAGKRLSADTINLSDSTSSANKGETLLDTARNLQAMRPDAIVIRHKSSGSPHFLARFLKDTAIINAGDGTHEHPTQALLDCLSLMQHYNNGIEGIKNKKIAIVGDIIHSRVARSNIYAHNLLGNQINLVGPRTLIPYEFKEKFPGNIQIFHNLKEGLKGVDIIMCLRLQLERQSDFYIPSLQEYTNEFFVSKKILDEFANKNYIVMHPGPVNRGVEVESYLIDSDDSLMTKQVTNGVAVRMAVLIHCCNRQNKMEEVYAAN